MATSTSPPEPSAPARSLTRRRRTAVGLVLMVLGTILALIGPGSSPASAVTHDGLTSIGTDTTPSLETYPEGLFPDGCGVTDGQILTGVQYSATGPVTAGPVGDMRNLPYLPAGTTLTMTFIGWVEGCESPISLAVKRAVGPDFDALTDQALLAFEACGPEAAGDLPACDTVGEGLRSLSLVMPESGRDCSYQTDAVIGPPLDVVGPDGSFYGSGLRGGGPTMLISADNEGPEETDGTNCQPPRVTLACAEGGVAVTIFNNDVFDDIRVTIVADGVDQAVDFEVLKNSSRTFVVPLTDANLHPTLRVFDPQREILAPTQFADVCSPSFAVSLCQEGQATVTVTQSTEPVTFTVTADGQPLTLVNNVATTPIGATPVTIEVFANGVSLGTQVIQPCGEPTAAAEVDCATDTVTVTTTQAEDFTVEFEVTVNGHVITENVGGVYTYALSAAEALDSVEVLVTATHGEDTTTLIDDSIEPCHLLAACINGKSTVERFTAQDVYEHFDGQFAVQIDEATNTWTSAVPVDFIMVVDTSNTVRSFVLPGNFTSGSFTVDTVTVTVNGSPVVIQGTVTDAFGNPVSAAAVNEVVAVTYCDGEEAQPTTTTTQPPTEVLGVTQTQPATLPTTGSSSQGQLAFALGLVTTGFGLVLLGQTQQGRLGFARRRH